MLKQSIAGCADRRATEGLKRTSVVLVSCGSNCASQKDERKISAVPSGRFSFERVGWSRTDPTRIGVCLNASRANAGYWPETAVKRQHLQMGDLIVRLLGAVRPRSDKVMIVA